VLEGSAYFLGNLPWRFYLQGPVVQDSNRHLAIGRNLFQQLNLRFQVLAALDIEHVEVRVEHAREHRPIVAGVNIR
jgi:hypothetical protein